MRAGFEWLRSASALPSGAVSAATHGRWIEDGGAYDPSAGSWERLVDAAIGDIRRAPTVVWTSSKSLVSGSIRGYGYDPDDDGWWTIRTVGAPKRSDASSATWTAAESITFRGTESGHHRHLAAVLCTVQRLTTGGRSVLAGFHTRLWVVQYGRAGTRWSWAGPSTRLPQTTYRWVMNAFWAGSGLLLFGGRREQEIVMTGQLLETEP